MKGNEKKISRQVAPRHVGRMVETIIGCKWSLTVLDLVARGIVRPGEMERNIEGLTAKVLNDCLRRLVQFSVLEKRSYPEIPPRVEYRLTEFGWKFRRTLDALDALEADFDAARDNTLRTGHSPTPSSESTPGAHQRYQRPATAFS
jgi:DNA-binding HxlR family transcriptional regulator